MVFDMEKLFCVVNDNYLMSDEYKYAFQAFQMSPPDEHTWRKFIILIDWMEKKFSKEHFLDILGKSYDLEDKILGRIQRPEDDDSSREIQTWLMSNLFRYVENPEEDYINKYVGKIKFTKMIISQFEGSEDIEWTPTKMNDFAQYTDKEIDIKIEIYGHDGSLRRYEIEYGWRDEWSTKTYEWKIGNIHKSQCICQIDETIYKQALKEFDNSTGPRPEKLIEYENYSKFTKKWAKLVKKMKIPGWYRFNPRTPDKPLQGHNMMKEWDKPMFDYLKEKRWFDKEIKNSNTQNDFAEKSQFFIDCSKLLGIGGEGIVIRKPIVEKIGPPTDKQKNEEFEALKIMPIVNPNEQFRMSWKDINKLKYCKNVVEYLNVHLDFIKVFEEKIFVLIIGKNYVKTDPVDFRPNFDCSYF